MCIKDYETEIGGQGAVRAVELLGDRGEANDTDFALPRSNVIRPVNCYVFQPWFRRF
jgi:hypothetical protein